MPGKSVFVNADALFSTAFDFVESLVRSLINLTAATALSGKDHCSDAETQQNTMGVILCSIF